ncbi:hypothetical protein [Amycolatopsis sp. NPDC098790]|uniref:hypothetical protein n=1 Tax=Amycolatopsis sp. NPDC098790 TaxID=3363939 RepID=UPI0037F62518
MADGSALFGVLGAALGASASTVAAWLTLRGQLRREVAQREYTELTRWTADKRALFRDIQVTANDWAHLLRRVARRHTEPGLAAVSDDELRRAERAFHAALYEAALLCGVEVCDLVDETEDELLRLTAALGRSTDYLPAAPPEQAAQAAAAALVDDFPTLRDIRVRLLSAMRSELADRSTPRP